MEKKNCSFCGKSKEELKKEGKAMVNGKVIEGKISYICSSCASALKQRLIEEIAL